MTSKQKSHFLNGTTERGITPFMFNSQSIKIVYKNGIAWFIAKDVCNILGIKQPTRTLENFPDDEKSKVSITHFKEARFSNNKVLCVNEIGLYRLIFQSRKKQAEEFKTWVFSEVLPQIRATGTYQKKSLTQLPDISHALKREKPIAEVLQIGKDLIQLKANTYHGDFLLKLNKLGISFSSASGYMKVYRQFSKHRTQLEDLSISKLLILSRFETADIKTLFDGNEVNGLTLSSIKMLPTRSFEKLYKSYSNNKNKLQQKLFDFETTQKIKQDFNSKINYFFCNYEPLQIPYY